ncbi:senecionine N-oxygenase-like isoform X2 [Arctopsyche grandis]|uniref:senecionine N-oxygenase-like isoform X2 n=1 Tax=Arctopsyche grandis TaxID=121162 RepID=UPI00406D6DA0
MQSKCCRDRTRIAVIGAGVGGLASLHHITSELPGADVVAFDINSDIGGTWIYNDNVGVDEYGIPLMSSMYKNLRTNLPKNVMEFPDFPIPSYYKTFMKHEEFLTYLRSYGTHFELHKYIKFRHLVTLVKFEDEKWLVTYENLDTKHQTTEIFDYVFVANGHYSEFVIPEYKGLDVFKGTQEHSHNYRTPDRYRNRTVLVIGSGPSGMDISVDVAKVSKKLIISHHNSEPIKSPFPSHYEQRPDVKEFTENSVIFEDGTSEVIDDILYCTGYAYYCPFLDNSCGMKIQRIYMYPLYRHVVNVQHPSMFFIGVPQLCCAVPMMDMQARYAVAAISGKFKLPSKADMIRHMDNDYKGKQKNSYKLARIATHTLGGHEAVYYSEMSEESGIKALPPVFCAIRYSTMETKSNLYTYRNYNYEIVDDEHFIRVYGNGTTDERKTIHDSKICQKVIKNKKKEESSSTTKEDIVKNLTDNFVNNSLINNIKNNSTLSG